MVYQKSILLGQFTLRNSLQSSYLEPLAYWSFVFHIALHIQSCMFVNTGPYNRSCRIYKTIHVNVISSNNGFQVISMILRAIGL